MSLRGVIVFACLFVSIAGTAPRPAPALEWESCPDCNVILISLSNIGTEHMSLYGYGRPTTPRLDRWAKQGVIFTDAFTHASWTLPVGASLFTSLYPYTHRLVSRELNNRLDEKIPTLAEILARRGYATAAFTGGLDYSAEFGHMRGFKTVSKNTRLTRFDATLSQASRWLARRPSKPFFLFLHGYDAHCPFQPSAPYRGIFVRTDGKDLRVDASRCVRGYQLSDRSFRAEYARENCKGAADCGKEVPFPLGQDDIDHLRDLYDETVRQVDDRVGGFLEGLDPSLLEKTIVIVFSDHGEMFAKHGRFGRAGIIRGTLYEDVLHIPLLMRFPRGPAKKVSGLVEIVDIMPTVLDFLGIRTPAPIQGESLLPLIQGTAAGRPYAYAGLPFYLRDPDGHYTVNTIAESIRGRRWKLIRESYLSKRTLDEAVPEGGERVELYDLRTDPAELVDLAEKRTDIRQDLLDRLQQWRRQAKAFTPVAAQTRQIPEYLRRLAEKHGYW